MINKLTDETGKIIPHEKIIIDRRNFIKCGGLLLSLPLLLQSDDFITYQFMPNDICNQPETQISLSNHLNPAEDGSREQLEYYVATYNHMFGCDGTSFWNNLGTHIRIHGLGEYYEILKESTVEPTIETIRKVGANGADIVSIQEVLGKPQFLKLEKEFEKLNYSDVHFGTGHQYKEAFVKKHKKLPPENVITILATKKPSKQIPLEPIPVPPEIGHGGGFVQARLEDSDLIVIASHFPLPMYRETFDAHTYRIIESIRGKMKAILMGDFNMPFAELAELKPQLREQFRQISTVEPTCSITPVIKFVHQKCVDYILATSDISALECGLDTEVRSDHALVWSKICV